jgi:DNA-binding LacI/PurR family transcriptional regulator
VHVKIPQTQLKYQRVEAEIRQFAQTLPLGAKLPAEREMAITYSCNFLTVRKALKRLVDDGTIVRRVGSGTFIARRPVDGNHAGGAPKGNQIGVLVSQYSNDYAHRVMQAVAHAGREQGLELRSIWVKDYGETTLAQVHQMKRDHCVAVILPWFPHERVDEIRRFVANSPLPVSLPLSIPGLEKNHFERPETSGISSTTSAAEDTIRYYYALGHRRIALIGPDSSNDLILQRKISGYVHFTSRENLPSFCGLVGPGAQAMDQLAERWKGFRGDLAIACYDDEHALRFMTAMHKIGLNAPTDYVIMGYNDTEASRYSDPPLTSVHQDFDYIGYWLMKNAAALAKGEVAQSDGTPRLRMQVRQTCGGRGKITEALRSQFQYLDIVVDNGGVVAATPEPAAQVESKTVELA